MEEFVYPQYSGTSLLNVPSTILSLFGAKPLKKTLPENYSQQAVGAEKIILFIIDGLGFNLIEKVGLKYSFFQNIWESCSPITTVFPSTTAAALNTLYSGLSPIEHGLPEWFVYFKELDALLASLPFTAIDPADFEKTLNPPPDILFKDKTIYQYLVEVGVSSFSLVPKGISDSFYSRTSHIGSTIVGFDNFNKFLSELVEAPGKAFLTVYYPSVDTAEHQFGPDSELVEIEISQLINQLSRFIENVDSKIAAKIAIMITSDHGQISIDPQKTIYLDEMKGLIENFNTTKSGKPIPPTSGTRNAFLSIKADKLDKTLKLLRENLLGKAVVLSMEQAISDGIFGPGQAASRFIDRTGNVLLIAISDYSLGYHYTPDFELNLLGRHGGLSEYEMLIPFTCARLSELKE